MNPETGVIYPMLVHSLDGMWTINTFRAHVVPKVELRVSGSEFRQLGFRVRI